MPRHLAIPALLAMLGAALGPTAASANLVTDPSFESGITGWSPYEGPTLTRVSGGHTGNYALQIASGGGTSFHFGIQDTPNWIGVVDGVGTRYRFTCWVRSDADHGTVKIKVKEYLGSSQRGSTAYASGVQLSPAWQMVTVDYVVTTPGSTIETVLEDYPAASQETYQVDDFSIEAVTGSTPPPSPPPPTDSPPVAKLSVSEVSSPALTVVADGSGSTDTDSTPIATYTFDFGDGSTPTTTSASSLQHTYSGGGTYTVTLVATDTGGNPSAPVSANVTVSAPSSTPPTAGNLVTDPSFESGITGWSPYEGPTLTRVSGGHTGSYALQARSSGGTSAHFGIQDSPNWIDVVDGVGTRYRFTCWVRSDAAKGTVKIKVKEYLGSSQRGSTAYASGVQLSPVWQMVTVDYVVTTLGSTIETVLEDYPAASGETYLIDDFSIVVATDGGTPPPPPPSPPPPGDNPPVAKLKLSVASSPDYTVVADGSGSTDTDSTPIATYTFDFGDGSSSVTTSSKTAQHTYAGAGTYTVSLIATDTGGLASSKVTAKITLSAPSSPPPPSGSGTIAVYAGYYDTHHSHTNPRPNPWDGSSNVVFVGKADNSSGDYDASAVRVDNLTGSTLKGVVVTVDIGSKHFALWGTNSIPSGGHLILTQTKYANFDGSDLNPAGCYSCSPNDCLLKVSHTIPVVHVTVGSAKTDYYDTGQILNTHGVDAAGCPYTGKRNDESQNWLPLSDKPPSIQPSSDPAGDVALTVGGKLSLSQPYPNPTHGDFGIRFRTPTAGVVQLGVYDIAGRLVRTCVQGILEPGEYTEYADLSGEAPGLYFCLLRTSEGAVRRTFILVK